MKQPNDPSVEIGDLSPDGEHMWDGDAWEPLWLLPDEVVDAVRVCFGLVVTAPYLLREGLLNQSWRLDSPDGRYVLRVSRPQRLREQAAYEHALIRDLHKHVAAAVVPIPGHDGDTVQQWGTNILSMFPYVEGVLGIAVAPD
ncbi:MAG: phosphotransferase, partial [Chloroflexia bacterium]